jgi:hypothetical protein
MECGGKEYKGDRSMKRAVLLWMVSVLAVLAGDLSQDLVCRMVEQRDIESMMGTTFKYEKVGKIAFPHTSYCEYGNGVLPKVSIYYYNTKNSVNMYDKTKEIKGLHFPAQAVFVPDSGDVVQIVSQTEKGTLSFVFNDGIKEQDEHYQKALLLIDQLSKKFP